MNCDIIMIKQNVGNFNPFRYRGYYYDSESGLYYLMSRYYDPVTHRFVNADGFFQSGGDVLDANMSIYCRNNPIMNYDPFGTDCICLHQRVRGDHVCYRSENTNVAMYAEHKEKGTKTLQIEKSTNMERREEKWIKGVKKEMQDVQLIGPINDVMQQ